MLLTYVAYTRDGDNDDPECQRCKSETNTEVSFSRPLILDRSSTVWNSGSAGCEASVFAKIKQRFLDGPMVRAPRERRALPFTLRYSSAEQTESGQTDSSLVPKVLFRIAREAWEGAGNASVRVIKARGKRKERKKERKRQKSNTETSLQFQSCADYRYRITLSEIISTMCAQFFITAQSLWMRLYFLLCFSKNIWSSVAI